jgi:3-deoxy-7-phosphoheptulonate synthase
MLIIMKAACDAADIEHVESIARSSGRAARVFCAGCRTVVALEDAGERLSPDLFASLAGVDEVAPGHRPYPNVLRSARPHGTTVTVGGVRIGAGDLTVIAGPCAVEDETSIVELAVRLREAGADILRGGAFKPRTSPYDFQGLGEPGLRSLARAREASGLPVVSEAVDAASMDLVEDFADMVQIGARNMQNFELLKRAGRSRLPIFLKRGFSARLDDLFHAAEYIMDHGNAQVVLCERGIRTFSDHSRFTLDLSVVPQIRRISHLPVFVDPSHASGRSDSVPALARAAAAAGSDGVMLEVHPDPARALSDGPQSLRPEELDALVGDLRELEALNARRREACP